MRKESAGQDYGEEWRRNEYEIGMGVRAWVRKEECGVGW